MLTVRPLICALQTLLAILLLTMPLAGPAPAADLSKGLEPADLPALEKGEMVLKVATAAGAQAYDLATLEALGAYRMTTRSLWDQDIVTFEGVLLADLLKDAGLGEIGAVELTALDGYSQIVPREDWTSYPVLLATREDGNVLLGSERGPLRVVYPLSVYPELDEDAYHERWVWSLARIKPVER